MKSNPLHDVSISLDVAAPTDSEREGEYVNRQVSFRRRLKRWLWHVLTRQFTLLCAIMLRIAGWIGRRQRQLLPGEACEMMLTGRFDSDNWILAHLGPLSASNKCSRVWMVSTNPVPALPKVAAIYPPKWLINIVGVTPARLLTFVCAAIRCRPHVVGGFHIIPNGIVAAIMGRLVGARSIYFCVGGPAEIQGGGGLHSDAHDWFARMEAPDSIVEKRLLHIVAGFDTVITMGRGAVSFLRSKGVDADCHVVSGGIDSKRFQPANEYPSFDLILTGRLARIKRIDVFLQALKNIVDKIPDVKAVIVGDGRLREDLQSLSVDLGIDGNVSFTGYQKDIANWLRKSKVFVLTSDSEGLSLSMMEAMMCGLPAVVSDVGDIADLVEDGVNGFLVPHRSPHLFATRVVELLSNKQKLTAFSQAARQSALLYTTEAATAKWDSIIEHYRTP